MSTIIASDVHHDEIAARDLSQTVHSEPYSSVTTSLAPSSTSSECNEVQSLEDSTTSAPTNRCCHCHQPATPTSPATPSSRLLPTPEGVVPLGAPPEFRGVIIPRQFRTKICKFFEEGLPCPYGTGCAFAHGDNEMRSAQQNEEEGIAVVNTVPVRAMVRYYSAAAAAEPQFVKPEPEPRLKDIQINKASSKAHDELLAASNAPPVPSYKLKKMLRERAAAAPVVDVTESNVEASSQHNQQSSSPTRVYAHNPYAYNVLCN